MDEGMEGFEKEVGEIRTSKIEVKDMRGEKADVLQGGEFKAKLESDKVEEKLTQFETFLGKYTKQKVSEGMTIGIAYGSAGNGEVVDGMLSVNLPNGEEIKAVESDESAKPFLDVLTEVGTTYESYVMETASSVVLHESAHMIIDSRPGSELHKDFKKFTNIDNDNGGHTLSLLDEGLVYAFQLENDSQSEVFKKLEEKKPLQNEESFTVVTRKRLGESLRGKVKEYMDGEKQVDEDFLKFAGEEMKKLDIERYVEEAENERLKRR